MSNVAAGYEKISDLRSFRELPYIWSIDKYLSKNLKNVCLSVISKFCLSSSSPVACLQPIHQLMWRPKILTKIRYVILVCGQIFDFQDSLFGQGENIDLCLKNTSKKLRRLLMYEVL